jgi:glycopeptide antibiotics resistance protein
MIAFTLSVIFGIAMRFCKDFYTTTRREDILDVAANVSGAALAILRYLFITKRV